MKKIIFIMLLASGLYGQIPLRYIENGYRLFLEPIQLDTTITPSTLDRPRYLTFRDSFFVYTFQRGDSIIIDSVLSHRLTREKYRDTTFKKDTLFSLAGSGHKTLDTATYLSGVWSYKFHRLRAWTNVTIKDTAGDLYFSSISDTLLNKLRDVDTTAIDSGKVLKWSKSSNKWIMGQDISGGSPDSTVWATRYWTTTRYDTIGHLHAISKIIGLQDSLSNHIESIITHTAQITW